LSFCLINGFFWLVIDAQAVVDVPDAGHGFGHILDPALGAAAIDPSTQGDFPLLHTNLNVTGIDLAVTGQTLANVFVNAPARTDITARTNAAKRPGHQPFILVVILPILSIALAEYVTGAGTAGRRPITSPIGPARVFCTAVTIRRAIQFLFTLVSAMPPTRPPARERPTRSLRPFFFIGHATYGGISEFG
jgi:hypothetical protein